MAAFALQDGDTCVGSEWWAMEVDRVRLYWEAVALEDETGRGRDDTAFRGDPAASVSPRFTAHFLSFAARISQLTRSIETLAASGQRVGVGPPQGREWFDLLQRKLLPQLQGPPLLIVAIVGGTNIGKSVVFNHLAGETASAATPLAAGTKHPVCLVPPGCDDAELLRRLFEHFELPPGNRPTIRWTTLPRIGFIGGWGPRCRRGWCWSMRRTLIPT